jgi:hypothetical protein
MSDPPRERLPFLRRDPPGHLENFNGSKILRVLKKGRKNVYRNGKEEKKCKKIYVSTGGAGKG